MPSPRCSLATRRSLAIPSSSSEQPRPRSQGPAERHQKAAAPDNAESGRPGTLWVMDAETGKPLHEQLLPALPVFDGMAATNGKLIVCLQDSSVLCLGH